jgi:hypothetical protein
MVVSLRGNTHKNGEPRRTAYIITKAHAAYFWYSRNMPKPMHIINNVAYPRQDKDVVSFLFIIVPSESNAEFTGSVSDPVERRVMIHVRL